MYWKRLCLQRRALRGSILEYILVIVAFSLLVCFYTDWIILDISRHMFVNHIGDGTAGFLWLNFADRDMNPLLGHTNSINYPYGDHLGDALFIVYSALWLPMWILARLFDSMTALNLITLWGYLSGAVGMYWLIKRTLGNAPIAFLSGFAVTFVPYHIINSTSHLAYIFSITFILIFAAFIGLWQKQTKFRALFLAMAVALAFYTDGYFILLASILIIGLCLGGVCYGLLVRYSIADFTRRLRYIGLAASIFLILALPLAYTQFSSSNVKTELSDARKPISVEIPFYAAKKIDFFAPPIKSPIFKDLQIYKDAQVKMADHSNYAENTLYIGFTLIALCLVGGIIFVLSFVRKNGKRLITSINERERRRVLFIACLAIAPMPIMLAFMAPPYIHVMGVEITMPSGFLIDNNIGLWRVMTRFFLPLHMLVVVCAALSLWLIFKQWGSRLSNVRVQWLIVSLLTILLACEYATTVNRPGFSINDVPASYSWLAQQHDIDVIAELPLVDRPFHVSYPYIAAQLVHNKKLVNSHLPSLQNGSRNALAAEGNPDTIDFAIQRGAKAIILHKLSACPNVSWGSLAHRGSDWPLTATGKQSKHICTYTDLRAPTDDKQFIHVLDGAGTEGPLYKKGRFYNQFYGNYLKLGVFDAGDRRITTAGRSELLTTLMTTPLKDSFTGEYRILQNGKVLSRANFNTAKGPAKVQAIIDPALDIEVRISDRYGNAPQPYQLSLGDVTITSIR